MHKRNKKGQITLFVILAIVIVVSGILVYQFVPEIVESTQKSPSPSKYMQDCLEGDLYDATEAIGLSGGTFEPDLFYPKDDIEISYLCYSNIANENCANLISPLKEHIESELMDELSQRIDSCFLAMELDFEAQGFNVIVERERDKIIIDMEEIRIESNTYVSLKKGDMSNSVDSFKISEKSNLLELLRIAKNIIDLETEKEDLDIRNYLYIYEDVSIRILRENDGTKIYRLEDKNSNYVFQFAVRSMVYQIGPQLEIIEEDSRLRSIFGGRS